MSGGGTHRRPVIRFPLRLKISALVAGVLVVAIGTYLVLALQLMRADKMAYVYDLGSSVADNLASQVRVGLESLEWKLRLYASVAADETDPRARRSLAVSLLESDPSLVRVMLLVRNEDGRLAVIEEIVAEERLEPLELTVTDLETLDEARPLPLTAVRAEEPVVLNRSLPPSAQLLSVILAAPGEGAPAWVLAADLAHDRLLDMFSVSKVYTAYLIDVDGGVLAHPERELVLARRSLAAVPVVQRAVTIGAGVQGAMEFEDGDGRAFLGSFANVGWGRLRVIAQIDRTDALAATDRLIGFSAQVGVAILLMALVLSIVFARRITMHISRLRAATQELAGGRYDVDPRISSRDEIGDLADDFRQMARQLRDTQVQLVQSGKLAAVGQLGAGITHEVKNPLSGIKGFAELGLMTIDDRAQVEESFRMIIDGATRSLDIVNNFLRFVRPSAGERSTHHLNDVVRTGVRIVAHELQTALVTLHLDLGEPPPVEVDEKQVQQVLVNLALNAQQAMNDGGNVWITTRTTPDGRAEIEVRDDGPGMDADTRARIFEPFFTTKGEGTGLGLAVSYRIITDHGGELGVDSEPGNGATFRIRLPAAQGNGDGSRT